MPALGVSTCDSGVLRLEVLEVQATKVPWDNIDR